MALRGLAYWPGSGGLHSRVFAGNGPFLLALDVTTGKPAPGFGNEGRLDVKQGVEYLKKRGVSKVILLGHSGGGATTTFYQAVAEAGPSYCQGPNKITPCDNSLAGLPRERRRDRAGDHWAAQADPR